MTMAHHTSYPGSHLSYSIVLSQHDSSFRYENEDRILSSITKMIDGIYHVFGELVVAHEVTLAAAITNLKRQLAICTVTKTPFTVCIPFLGIARPKSQFPHFMCRWAIYIFPGSVHIFPAAEEADRLWEYINWSRVGRSIVGINKSLTDTWLWKLGLWPRNSFSGNICFKFSVLVLCSVW